MTEAEKKHVKEVYAAMQIGYELADQDRRERIRQTITVEALQSLRGAFREAAKLPMRPSSGLIEYYAGLKKVK